MYLHLMKSKIHRATVTGADLTYEGSISICPELLRAAGLYRNERVDIYNCNNGARFTTYAIEGRAGEIVLNGAAARHVHKGDLVIIVAYAMVAPENAQAFEPNVVFVDAANAMRDIRREALPPLQAQ